MSSRFELTFPCFIVRRNDESRFAVVRLPGGDKAIAILTDPQLLQTFVSERWSERVVLRPLPVNTPVGLARILSRYLPKGVTRVVFNPNGVRPIVETVDELVRLLQRAPIYSDTIDF